MLSNYRENLTIALNESQDFFAFAAGTALPYFYIDIHLCCVYYIDKYKYVYERCFVENKKKYSARVFKAFCDENRLTVLELLQSGEQCACVLLEKMKITQPTLSHHMKILVDSGIVVARKEGKWMYYSISAAGCEEATLLMKQFTSILETKTEGCCI
jgi:ArsR family transcriptional regulator